MRNKVWLVAFLFPLGIFGWYDQATVSVVTTDWNNSCNMSCAVGTDCSCQYVAGSPKVLDVVYTNGAEPPSTGCFCNATASNPKVIQGTGGNWSIFPYGDDKFDDTRVGDAIVEVGRESGGAYKLDATRTCAEIATAGSRPIMAFRMVRPEEVDLDWTWEYIGGLGTGVAVIQTPQATQCGYRYFAVVPANDSNGTRWDQDEDHSKVEDDRYFLTWAMSRDGIAWEMLPQPCTGPHCPPLAPPCDHVTDADLSKTLIYRQGWLSGLETLPGSSFGPPWPWWHLGGFYSDPARGGDGWFYFAITYYVKKGAGCINQGDWSGGVHMFRIFINFATESGLGEMQQYRNNPKAFVAFNGVIAQTRNCQSDLNSYLLVPDCNDPMDLTVVRNGDGAFHSLILTCADWSTTGMKPVMYVAGQYKDPFTFGPKRDFDTCSLSAAGYWSCGGGSEVWHMGLFQPPNAPPWQSFYDPSTKEPLKLLGYFSAGKSTVCCYPISGGCDCGRNTQGLAFAEVALGTQNAIGEVQGLKVQKDTGGSLRLAWNPYPGMKYNIAEGDLDLLRQGVYSHRRKSCGVTQLFKTITPLYENAYFLLTPECPSGSEGSFGRASSGQEIPQAVGYCAIRFGGLP